MIDFIMNFPRMLEGFMTMLLVVILTIFGFVVLIETWRSERRRKKNATTEKS